MKNLVRNNYFCSILNPLAEFLPPAPLQRGKRKNPRFMCLEDDLEWKLFALKRATWFEGIPSLIINNHALTNKFTKSSFSKAPKYWVTSRSEERRVGKECRSRWTAYH